MERIIELQELSAQLMRTSSSSEKLALLNESGSIKKWIQSNENRQFLSQIPPPFEGVFKQLIVIGQWETLLSKAPLNQELLFRCLETLAVIDSFYAELGGLVGYQSKILSFLKASSETPKALGIGYHPPSFVDIERRSAEVDAVILDGIEALAEMAEMYPLGGAADRLHLVDEITGEELPAANLCYNGRPLLEGLIRDLQAREFLYFKLQGKQMATPVAIMTSFEKNNHRHLLEICEKRGWFGRPKELFQFFTQPLVPAVDSAGNWCMLAPFKPLLKPGGHGVIWKLARDFGIFEWFEKQKRTKALIRQINNPITALDYGLLAFMGWGHKKKMTFGFASCPRLLQSAEGVNVVIEKEAGEIVLTNIEYCDFKKFGIADLPLKEGEPYSRFSSNTNILFVDLKEVCRAVEKSPFPGLLINLKTAAYTTSEGEKKEAIIARLESTMQNIADVFVEKKKDSFATEKTFVTYNQRHKTIATVKKAACPGRSLEETAENCLYVQLQAARELLETECSFLLPPAYCLSKYLEKGPDCFFLYHPALGPLYSIIRQKIRGGSISLHSELQLEIADADIENLTLEGSLLVEAKNPIGHFNSEGHLILSHRTGRCTLHNVTVKNQGVDWMSSSPFWRNQFSRKETVEIVLEGFSEFVAKGVVFYGHHQFIVPDGMRMEVKQVGKELRIEMTRLEESSFWEYRINERQVELTARRNV